MNLRNSFRTLAGLAALTLPCWANSVNVAVPGIADIWLAGQPNGATVGSDSVPANAALPSSAGLTLTSGKFLAISATGQTDFGGCLGTSPDGTGCGIYNFAGVNGLSGMNGPADALVGVFIGSGVPGGSAPADTDFSTTAAQSVGTISPLLDQVFFIGDGLTGTGNGSAQKFKIPVGATRLFLASSDTAGANYNNSGTFQVTLNDGATASATPEPGTVFLVTAPLALAALLRKRQNA